MRVRVDQVFECYDEPPTFRIVEQDGRPVDRWLPSEPPEPMPLDCGGFSERRDAEGFALGVNRERALFGLLTESVEEIDAERAKLDGGGRIKSDENAQLDLGALLHAVNEPAAPVVEHRRRRVA